VSSPTDDLGVGGAFLVGWITGATWTLLVARAVVRAVRDLGRPRGPEGPREGLEDGSAQ
jgi:hypothetical protein